MNSSKIDELLDKGILVTPDMLEGDDAKIKIVSNYTKKSKKRKVQDFVKYFNLRFKAIERMLKLRPEMQGLISINRLKNKAERENVSIIGMVNDKQTTKNDNIILTLEDLTGKITVLIHQKNTEIYEAAKDIVLDEVIGVVGQAGNNIIFANNVVFPDVPLNKELKKSPNDVNAVFIGDTHFGSKVFLEEEFKKFIEWINGRTGTPEQREMAKKTKYIFFIGDMVEGVGIYPGQEEDLEVPDVTDQYKVMSEYLAQIPQDKKLIICAGNHDACRIAEPQPPLYNDFAKSVWELPNAIIVSNPSLINIVADEKFSGLDVLMYHGYSLIYYSNNIPSIRNAGGQKRVDLIIKFLLQRRHLAITHQSNLYIPDDEEDPLVISSIPDIFVTGHIHRASATQYRNVTLLNTSCWSEITEDQEKRGLEPQPGRVFVINLHTRKTKVINFYGK